MKDPALCASIPSSVAAFDLVSPDVAAVPAVVGTMFGRALLIAIGLRTVRDTNKHLVRDSMASAVALECFLIFYAGRRTAKHKAATQLARL